MVTAELAQIARLAGSVPDPEIPALNLSDLGIYRSTEMIDGVAVISLTPTYSGCPATEAIRKDVISLLGAEGYSNCLRPRMDHRLDYPRRTCKAQGLRNRTTGALR
jgi:metal-sulfur cluster biosynthetic enzyme